MNDKTIKILLIEDNAGDIRLIREMLTEAKYIAFDLECVDRLSTGLERNARGDIDIILLDLGLLDSQGLDTFNTINDQTSKVPIIVLTAFEDDAWAIKAVRNGAQDYLVKGKVDSTLLVRTIRYALERKKAEKELASSKEFLNSVIEQSPGSLWISDSEGTLIKMNLACRKLFGVTDEEAVGKYNILKDNLIKEQGFMPLVENIFENGEIAQFTIDYDLPRVEHVKVKGATHRILDVIISPIKDMHGKVINAIVQHKDITERRKAEELLQKSEKKWINSFNSLEDVMLITDLDYVIENINDIGLKLFGKIREEVIGKKCYQVIHNLDAPVEHCPFQRTLKTRNVESVDLYDKTFDKYFNVKSSPIFNKGNEIVGHVDLIRDITERKKTETELQKARDTLEIKVMERTEELHDANIRLKELGSLKSAFISSMSHELRTPLNSIIGFTGIMLQGMAGELTGEQRRQLTIVKKSGDHLLALISDVIDVSRIEANHIELDVKEFDFSDMVRDVRDSFKVTIDEKGLKLVLEVPEKLMVESDERRMKQVIMNLVSNAVKFTDEGAIKIRVVEVHGKVEVAVEDTGIGLKDEDMTRLFKQFSRILVEGRQIEKGTGLGLYISKKVSELLGGEVKVESTFGVGSTFTVVFPLRYGKVKR